MIALKEVANYVKDKMEVSSLKLSEYISTDNMLPNRRGVINCEKLPNTKKVIKYEFGDILISNIRPYFKKIWYADRIGGCSNDVIVFRTNTNNFNSRFLYYVLSQDSFFDFMMASANGTKMPRGNKKIIPNFRIPKFDIKKQNKIANILSAYDDLIENNQKQIKLLEEAAKRLYKEWFIDLRFPGYEDVDIVDGVPEGWEFKPLNQVFNFIRGKSYSSKELVDEGGILMVNLKNLKAFGGYNRNLEKRFTGKYRDDQVLVAGDIIMGITDMTQERRLVGHVAIVPDIDEPMTFSMDLIKLVPLIIKKSFLYSTMFFGGYSKSISALANGVNVLHLKPQSFMNMEMLIPTVEIMKRYDYLFKQCQKKIELLQKQIDLLIQARDRLLPKLMSGELEGVRYG